MNVLMAHRAGDCTDRYADEFTVDHPRRLSREYPLPIIVDESKEREENVAVLPVRETESVIRADQNAMLNAESVGVVIRELVELRREERELRELIVVEGHRRIIIVLDGTRPLFHRQHERKPDDVDCRGDRERRRLLAAKEELRWRRYWRGERQSRLDEASLEVVSVRRSRRPWWTYAAN